MTILITGSEGFIGSHLVEFLLDNHHENVIALVKYNFQSDIGNMRYIKNLDDYQRHRRLVQYFGYTNDYIFLDKLFEERTITKVYHLASNVSVPYSFQSAEDYIQSNIKGTYNIAKLCNKYQAKLIHISSSEVYGNPEYTPIDEIHPYNPRSPYAASKIASDMFVLAEIRQGLDACIVRPFNTFGPRQSARAVIPSIISQYYLNNKSIMMGNLKSIRDFNYIDDTIKGIYLVGQKGRVGEIYNIGSGEKYSMGDIPHLIFRDCEIIVSKERLRRRAELQELHCNYFKANEELGYSPEITFKDGLKLTNKWIKKHIDNFDWRYVF